MISRTEKLIASLQEAFEGEPWLGESVMSKLGSIQWQLTNITMPHSSNSIAILVRHILNWRIFTLKKLEGNLAYDIEMNSEADWTPVTMQTEADWLTLIDDLQSSQKQILEFLRKQKDDSFLETIAPGRTYSLEYLLNGLVQHDLYHLGQIGLLYRYALGHQN